MVTFRSLMLIFLTFFLLAAQEEKKAVAVLPLDGIDITSQEVQILTKKLSSELVKIGKFTVLDRGEMEAILEEQGFQQTGCTSSECAVEMGQILGVQLIITGSVGRLNSLHYVEIRLIDVGTSQIIKTVDHNQPGTIEDVLITSMPILAADLSGDVTEKPRSIHDVPKEPEMIIADEPQVTDEAPVEYGSAHEVTLVAHHGGAELFMNNVSVGKNRAVVTLPASGASLYEKRWFYTSTPQRIKGTDPRTTIGVGGKPKEAVLSLGYFTGGNSDIGIPGFSLTTGILKQSSRSSGVNFIIGGLSGFTTFDDDEPDIDLVGDTAVILLGAFVEWRYEWELAEIFKVGLGFDLGYLVNKTQLLDYFYFEQVDNSFIVRHDVLYNSFGGPQLKLAVGYKHVYFETKFHFTMGNEQSAYYGVMDDDFEDPYNPLYWEKLVDFPAYKETSEFVMNPMISLNLLFTR